MWPSGLTIPWGLTRELSEIKDKTTERNRIYLKVEGLRTDSRINVIFVIKCIQFNVLFGTEWYLDMVENCSKCESTYLLTNNHANWCYGKTCVKCAFFRIFKRYCKFWNLKCWWKFYQWFGHWKSAYGQVTQMKLAMSESINFWFSLKIKNAMVFNLLSIPFALLNLKLIPYSL